MLAYFFPVFFGFSIARFCPENLSLRSWRNIVARARPTRGSGGGAANRSEQRSREIPKRLLPILFATSPPVFTINLEPRVSPALCQRLVAGRNSGITEFLSLKSWDTVCSAHACN